MVVVLSAYKQIRNLEQPVLSDIDEDNFDKAFEFFKPVIQGLADSKNISKDVIAKTVEFCANAFDTELSVPVLENGEQGNIDDKNLSPGENAMLNNIAERKLMRPEDTMHVGAFATDVISGMRMEMTRGSLGLRLVA